MMFSKAVTTALLLLCANGVSAFVSQSSVKVSSTSLQMRKEDSVKKIATSFVAAAFLMVNTVAVAPAVAYDDLDFGSSQAIAARSGGRTGGRSSSSSYRAPSSSSSTTNTRVIERTTYVAPMYSSPAVIMAPSYGYNPMPGLGLSLGLNAVSNIGNDMRDYRQETEIQRTRAELETTKARSAEMEARMRQLEMNQQMSQIQNQQMLMQSK